MVVALGKSKGNAHVFLGLFMMKLIERWFTAMLGICFVTQFPHG